MNFLGNSSIEILACKKIDTLKNELKLQPKDVGENQVPLAIKTRLASNNRTLWPNCFSF